MPVYNVENYIRQALDSLLSQTFTNWEAIIVDDGSTDNSGVICDQYAARDERLKVVHQKNGGQSSARNKALSLSKGKYITFVDSDDWLNTDHLAVLRDILIQTDADVAQTSFFKDYRGFQRKKILVDNLTVIEGEKVYDYIMKNSSFPGFLWNKIFKREVIISPFIEGRIYEDFMALTEWSQVIRKIAMTPLPTYHYRMREGSSMSQNSTRNFLTFLEAHKIRAKKFQEKFPRLFNDEINGVYLFSNFVKIAKYIARAETDTKLRLDTVAQIARQLNNVKEYDTLPLKKKLRDRGLLLLSSPENFIKKMRRAGKLDLYTKFCNSRRYE